SLGRREWRAVTQKKSRPDDYEPPYPAFTSQYPPDQAFMTLVQVGVQHAEGADAARELSAVIASMEGGENAPQHYERAHEIDARGRENHIVLAYWRSPEALAAWEARPDVRAWRETTLAGDVGIWVEAFSAPIEHLDPNYSLENIRWGSGRHVKQKWERYHSYYGSMRDRIPHGHSKTLDPPAARIARVAPPDSLGKRLRIRPPDRVCFIRGAFGWEEARPEEQQGFMDDMYPVYRNGAMFLRDNPIETNCISLRFAEEIQVGESNGVQSESLGWFLSLKDLENWVHHHPTHAAIFRGVFEYMHRYNFDVRLNLGHEVIVVPEGRGVMDYNNCHPDTGFLPFFEAERLDTAD
ncbi:MAG: phenylacetaldoxime dehydratase family protein, partial [Pseudomonadota bacterium]